MYEILLFLHVIGAAVLMGTGAGIAFFMVISVHRGQPAEIAHVAGIVVLADTVFTATAAIAQPITGLLLARTVGWSLWDGWLAASIALYVVIGALWLPVVWIQIRLRDLAASAAATDTPLPATFHRLWRIWLACGVPAFAAILALLWLMLHKPDLGG